MIVRLAKKTEDGQEIEKFVKIKIVKNGNDISFAAIENSKMAANAICEFKPQNDHMWIDHITTLQEHKRQGYGAALLKAIEYVTYENMLYEIQGYYGPEEQDVWRFYEKSGYRIESDNYQDNPLEFIIKEAEDVSADITVEAEDDYMLNDQPQID